MQLVSPNRKRWLVAAWVVVLSVVGVALGALSAQLLLADKQVVPQDIVKRAKAPVYVPSDLPGKFAIDRDSFAIQEDVLLFRASDGLGGQLAFSEQLKPKDINFEDFYKQRFRDVRTLSEVAYPSVWGKTLEDRLMLSILANDTWLLMTTTAPLGENDMVRIAKSIRKVE